MLEVEREKRLKNAEKIKHISLVRLIKAQEVPLLKGKKPNVILKDNKKFPEENYKKT
jgi:hypothetical protein